MIDFYGSVAQGSGVHAADAAADGRVCANLLCGRSQRHRGGGRGALSSFAFCDFWYFLRMGLHALTPAPRGPRKHLFAVSKVKGRIGLMDIDRNGHCNNARFLRECGFGRRDLWQHNGVWKVVTAAGGNLVVGSQTVRYRRELSFGQAYTMQSRLICWDKRAFYVEHRFVTHGTKGDFVNAIVLVKNTVLGALSPAQIVAKLPALQSDEEATPPCPRRIGLDREQRRLQQDTSRRGH
ncbi:HotDog domain [Phytophthora cactorum]|nr:HotDog domain [Phytophthora cactorum]